MLVRPEWHAFTPPMECRPVQRLPDGPERVYELNSTAKVLRRSANLRVSVCCRDNGKDFAKRFPRVAAPLSDAIDPGTVDRYAGCLLTLEERNLFSERDVGHIFWYLFHLASFQLSAGSDLLGNALEVVRCESFGTQDTSSGLPRSS